MATLVGATAAPLPGAGDIPTGFDFNPTVDRMRYVNTNFENARFNPNNGALAGDDTNLTPASVEIIGEAYDRNVVNGGATTLYAINRNGNQLAIQGGIDGGRPPARTGASSPTSARSASRSTRRRMAVSTSSR